MSFQRTDLGLSRGSGGRERSVRRPIEALGRAVERLRRRLCRRGPDRRPGSTRGEGAGGGADDDLLDEMAIW